jgi:hypothetical protein
MDTINTVAKLSKICPIFADNLLKNKFNRYINVKPITVVELICITPTNQLKLNELYWGYKSTSSTNWYYNNEYPVYKIFLPILGARKYDPKRFKVINEFIINTI